MMRTKASLSLKIFSVTALFFWMSLSQAEQKFHCYSAPNHPVQAYEYTNIGCKPGERSHSLVNGEGEKDILCTYVAICKPVTNAVGRTEPPEMSQITLAAEWQAGSLKTSFLSCKGKGTYTKSILTHSNCPTATECQRNIFYNAAQAGVEIGLPKAITAPNQTEKSTR